MTAKLDTKGVISRIGDSVVNVDGAIAVVLYVNVNDLAEITDRDSRLFAKRRNADSFNGEIPRKNPERYFHNAAVASFDNEPGSLAFSSCSVLAGKIEGTRQMRDARKYAQELF